MSRLLLINCRPDERRVALIEDGLTTELFFERISEKNVVGNIYKGRVRRVLPGMQAAFVEIGLSRTGFLYVGDVVRELEPDKEPADDEGEGAETEEPNPPPGRGHRYPPINTLLTQGQEILVQVSKGPIGTKGARLTTNITLPGRRLVYMPVTDHLGISRRITDDDERTRLREIAERIKPEDAGIIIRTVGEGAREEEFVEDLAFLERVWEVILKKVDVAKAPEPVHLDLDVTLRSIRDILTVDVDRILVDDPREAARIKQFVERFIPRYGGTIEVWMESDSMFERFGLDWEISRAMRRRVWLRSGGYIIFDHTEALTVIDVNSGSYVGAKNLEETIFDVNLEAAREIAYQLRLRDIGGIIVIDFIDMARPDNRARVTEALSEALGRDRARSHVLPMSDIGLVEMTRKRVRNSIVEQLTEPCFYCDGRGFLQSVQLVVDDLLSKIRQHLLDTDSRVVAVMAHPRVTERLVDTRHEALTRLERTYSAEIQVIPRDDLHLEQVELS